MSLIFEMEMLESKDVCIMEKMWEDFLEDEERIPETLSKQTNRPSGNNYNKRRDGEQENRLASGSNGSKGIEMTWTQRD